VRPPYDGPERRSPESLLARELVVVKGQADPYEAELTQLPEGERSASR
jgi:hypothetical protein